MSAQADPADSIDLAPPLGPEDDLRPSLPEDVELEREGIRGLPQNRCRAMSKVHHRQCMRAAIPGGQVCSFHGGNAPQVRHAALLRLLEAMDEATAVHMRLLRSRDERIQLAAVKEIYDRVALGDEKAKVIFNTLIVDRPDIDAKIDQGLDRVFAEYERRKELKRLPASSDETRER